MANINIATIKQEIKDLTEERDKLASKIDALEQLLNAYRSEKPTNKSTLPNGKTTRTIEIEPILQEIFGSNNNKPLKKKEISDEIVKLRPDLKDFINNKLTYAVRPSAGLLVKSEYGKYQFAKMTIENKQE